VLARSSWRRGRFCSRTPIFPKPSPRQFLMSTWGIQSPTHWIGAQSAELRGNRISTGFTVWMGQELHRQGAGFEGASAATLRCGSKRISDLDLWSVSTKAVTCKAEQTIRVVHRLQVSKSLLVRRFRFWTTLKSHNRIKEKGARYSADESTMKCSRTNRI
jgi:hypothetical protein